MDKDIFAEVRHIEEEAERILARGRAEREESLRKARDEAGLYGERSRKKLEEEAGRRRTEHQHALADGKASLEEDFEARKASLDQTAASRIDELADWVVSRFLEESR